MVTIFSVALTVDDGAHAAARRHAVDVHRAGAALRHAAAVLGAGQPELLAQHPEQGRVGFGLELAYLAVDVQAWHGNSFPLRGLPTVSNVSAAWERNRDLDRRCFPTCQFTRSPSCHVATRRRGPEFPFPKECCFGSWTESDFETPKSGHVLNSFIVQRERTRQMSKNPAVSETRRAGGLTCKHARRVPTNAQPA